MHPICFAMAVNSEEKLHPDPRIQKLLEEQNRLNNDCTLSRHEFLECIIRLSFLIYRGFSPSPAKCVEKFFQRNVKDTLPQYTIQDEDQFRMKVVYARNVDQCFRRYLDYLEVNRRHKPMHTYIHTYIHTYTNISSMYMSVAHIYMKS